ncbi:hypothetical protein J6590_074444 [Homalodisca vitripennis]|nr:hypothetical protein J6590_074444 [Homalodisca vitripennis]
MYRKKKLSSLRTDLAISQDFFGTVFNFNNVSVGDPKSLHSPGTSSPVTSSSESKVPGGEYLDEVHAFLLRKLCRWAQAITTYSAVTGCNSIGLHSTRKTTNKIPNEFSTTRLPLEWRPLKILSLVPRVGGEENTNISNDGLDDDIASTTKTTEGTPKEKSVAQVNRKRVLQQPASAMPVSSAKKMSKTKMAENACSVITSILNKPKDQFDIYGEHVASVIRQLQTKREQAMVKHDINNILFKAEM